MTTCYLSIYENLRFTQQDYLGALSFVSFIYIVFVSLDHLLFFFSSILLLMSSSSSSSPSSSSSSQDGEVGGGGDFEGPSSSRQRSGNGVWPEPFVEALASQVAIDASRSNGRLAAAPALASVFQVCSTWRAVSRSDLLWRNLCRRIWGRTRRLHDTWREEFIYRHRTALNFRNRRYNYTTLDFDPAYVSSEAAAALSCRCLALSDFHLAVGFVDGTVRLFDLATRLHVSTCFPHHQGLLGSFSRAVSGIILSRTRLVFASLYGDVHVAALDTVAPLNAIIPARHVHIGHVVDDGALVDFAGCNRWWVGLYAGVPGQAFRIWDSETEEPVFVGGSLTDPEAVMGWHMFTELTDFVGRIRVTSQESAVACTSRRVIVFNLRNRGDVHGDQEFGRGIIVGSLDANNEAYVIVDGRGVASVRRAENLEEVCRFIVRGTSQRRVLGCMNGGYALICTGDVIRAWEVEHGVYQYNLRERMVGDLIAMVADDRHVAACNSDTTIHLWDFGAQ